MKKAVKTVGFMFIMILLAKVLGQVREMFIASAFGAGSVADAYYAASTLPLNLFDIVFASAISSAFIPVYNSFAQKDGVAEGDRFASSFVNVIVVGSVAVSVLLMIFSGVLVKIMAPGLSGEVYSLAVKLTVIMMPIIVFASLTFCFTGILQSKGEFNVPAVISIVSNGFVIIYLVFFNKYFGIYGLAVSLLIGWFLQFVVQLPSARKNGFKYQRIFYHKGLKDVVKLALPVLAGTWIQPISNMINNAYASSLKSGISSLNYASKLYLIVSAVFTVSVTNYVFPLLSKQSASESKDDYKKTLCFSFKIIVAVLIPITVLMLALHTPIIEIVYKRGSFDDEALCLTSGAFFWYCLGIIFYGVLDLLNKAFYAQKNSIVPAVTAISAIFINVVLSYILKNAMGIYGLALSATLVYAFMATVLFVTLNKKVKFISLKDGAFFLKALIYGAVSFAGTKAVFSVLLPIDTNIFLKIVRVGLSCAAGVLIYGIFIVIFEKNLIKELKKN